MSTENLAAPSTSSNDAVAAPSMSADIAAILSMSTDIVAASSASSDTTSEDFTPFTVNPDVPSPPSVRSQAEFLAGGIIPIAPVPGEDCPIRRDEMASDVVKIAACSHTFHCSCIVSWFEGSGYVPNTSCPYCCLELYDRPSRRSSIGSIGSFGSLTYSERGRTPSLEDLHERERDGETWIQRQYRLIRERRRRSGSPVSSYVGSPEPHYEGERESETWVQRQTRLIDERHVPSRVWYSASRRGSGSVASRYRSRSISSDLESYFSGERNGETWYDLFLAARQRREDLRVGSAASRSGSVASYASSAPTHINDLGSFYSGDRNGEDWYERRGHLLSALDHDLPNPSEVGSYYAGDRNGEDWYERRGRLRDARAEASHGSASWSELRERARRTLDRIRSSDGMRNQDSSALDGHPEGTNLVQTIRLPRSSPHEPFTVRISAPVTVSRL
ncbi:hypothetical protein CC86DRAFT_410643 [Ophiobolus disseminans]|uniref:RING-type domain-containing protein n=1 Tax=Ophiobolus disseminans TaxID=1469910 RepID=A0A6A6ZMD6_9PLEO|nr:hypothetical protein CC86DRAFT_410643 [Ophiobolus disseminans]